MVSLEELNGVIKNAIDNLDRLDNKTFGKYKDILVKAIKDNIMTYKIISEDIKEEHQKYADIRHENRK